MATMGYALRSEMQELTLVLSLPLLLLVYALEALKKELQLNAAPAT